MALCDCYQPALEKAAATVRAKYGSDAKSVKDFREVLADKSIDAVCISTPDHWHAYMTVEACKAGKDVYVEKPACTRLDEGPKMVAASRQYQRVVQGGDMQRTMPTFLKAKEFVDSGVLGEITWCKTWATGLADKAGKGNPPDGAPIPAGLDWDMWLGPAPKVPFNQNRWGVDGKQYPTFRYFWDYAGGEMTDWGVHYIDPIHLGTDAYVVVTRGGCWLAPSRPASKVEAVEYHPPRTPPGTPPEASDHWKNFLECVKTRATPAAEIERLVRSSASCLLANVSMRARTRVDLDAQTFAVRQPEAAPFTRIDYRAPWKL